MATCFGLRLDQILHSEAWLEVQTVSQPQTILIILGNDFEAAVEADYSSDWDFGDSTFAEMVQEAKGLIKPLNNNQAKGLIARYVARNIISNRPNYCPAFIRRIADVVNAQLGFIVLESGNERTIVDDEDILSDVESEK